MQETTGGGAREWLMGQAGSEEGGYFSLQSGKSSQASEGESRELT